MKLGRLRFSVYAESTINPDCQADSAFRFSD